MKIAVLTSGGDAPGMNACIRSVVRCALSSDMEVVGIRQGYRGIRERDFLPMKRNTVSNIIQAGGTFLQTDRCAEMLDRDYRVEAGKILRAEGIEGLVVIGGDGSFRGASDLSADTGINVIGIPGTIDNDLAYTERTLGFDTSVNNVLWAINSLRDTMQSHNKVTFVEVMGRHCGDIALHAGLTGGAEYILVPEVPFDIRKIAEEITASANSGKKSNLVILAEGAGKLEEVCEQFEKFSGIKPRQTRLGFIQRGGSPTHEDRLLACRFGIAAVDLLKDRKTNRVVGLRDGKIFDMDLMEAVSMKKQFDMELYRAAVHLR